MRIFLGNWQIIALDFFLCKAFEMSKAFQIQKAFKNMHKAFKMSIILGTILRTCERNRHLEDDSQRRQGLRRRRAESENPLGSMIFRLSSPTVQTLPTGISFFRKCTLCCF